MGASLQINLYGKLRQVPKSQCENSGSPPIVIKSLVWCTQCRSTLNNRAGNGTFGQQYRVWQNDASTFSGN
jgi:hypothetical protein